MILLIILILCIFLFSSNKESFVNQDLKEIHSKIKYGLNIIDKLFTKHNIYYSIAYGTLLGAVRHHDIIPWDDDADLNVLRKDYYKIIALKDEFEKYGLKMVVEWKLIKIYFGEKDFPFIDLFINDTINNKIIRCVKPYNKYCYTLNKKANWFWKFINYPSEWILKTKRFKFGNLELNGPIESEKILKYWYGNNCLTECYSSEINHITGETNIKPQLISCGELPKLQL
jgi:phosphorylcholine metabolism protein LicD